MYTTIYDNTQNCIILRRIILHHTISHHTTPYYSILLYYTVYLTFHFNRSHFSLHHITTYYNISQYITPYYVLLLTTQPLSLSLSPLPGEGNVITSLAFDYTAAFLALGNSAGGLRVTTVKDWTDVTV